MSAVIEKTRIDTSLRRITRLACATAGVEDRIQAARIISRPSCRFVMPRNTHSRHRIGHIGNFGLEPAKNHIAERKLTGLSAESLTEQATVTTLCRYVKICRGHRRCRVERTFPQLRLRAPGGPPPYVEKCE